MGIQGSIGNSRLLQLVAGLLGMDGIRRFPADLDINGTVKPVIDLGRYTDLYDLLAVSFGSTSIAGLLIDGFTITGNAITTVGTLGGPLITGPDSQNREYKVVASYMLIAYDGAGAAADAGRRIGAWHTLTAAGLSGTHQAEQMEYIVEAARTDYEFFYPQGVRQQAAAVNANRSGPGWDGRVPCGAQLSRIAYRQAGAGFFPANTTINGSMLLMARPAGVKSWPV